MTKPDANVYRCPRCNGRGTDPEAQPRQSCVVCWGEGVVNVYREGWEGQWALAMREMFWAHGTPEMDLTDVG